MWKVIKEQVSLLSSTKTTQFAHVRPSCTEGRYGHAIAQEEDHILGYVEIQLLCQLMLEPQLGVFDPVTAFSLILAQEVGLSLAARV